jgi:hypothetical protein
MNDPITIVFATIGFSVSSLGIIWGSFWVLERSGAAKKKQEERHREVLRKLENLEQLVRSTRERS